MVSPIGSGRSRGDGMGEDVVPRMACALCRRRKLRCDRQLPCDSCVRLGFECNYEASRSQPSNRQTGSGKSERKTISNRGPMARAGLETRPRSVAKKPSVYSTTTSEWGPEQMSAEELAELEQSFFDTVHQSIQILHQARYCMGIQSEPRLRPPNYLRYIVCALGASAKGSNLAIHTGFYRAARRLLDQSEYQDGPGQGYIIARPQAWILITIYEMLQLHFSRWCTSAGRAVRLSQIMGLHVIDAQHAPKRFCPPVKDWVELEEQRRAFWMCFNLDRYAAFGHRCPMIIDEKDIHCLLPASEEAYQSSTEIPAITFQQALGTANVAGLNLSETVIALTVEAGHKLKYLQQNDFSIAGQSSSSDIWQKINFLDETLHYAFLVPPHLAASGFVHTPMLTFLHMSAPTSTIALHCAAEEQASAHGITPSSLLASQDLRLAAAEMVASTMKLASLIEVGHLHPLTGVCLSTAAGVFMRSLAVRHDEGQMRSLKVLLDAMSKLQAANPLSGGYFKELDAKFPGIRRSIYERFASPPLDNRSNGHTHMPAQNDSGDYNDSSTNSLSSGEQENEYLSSTEHRNLGSNFSDSYSSDAHRRPRHQQHQHRDSYNSDLSTSRHPTPPLAQIDIPFSNSPQESVFSTSMTSNPDYRLRIPYSTSYIQKMAYQEDISPISAESHLAYGLSHGALNGVDDYNLETALSNGHTEAMAREDPRLLFANAEQSFGIDHS